MRRAFLKQLASSLVLHGSIVTTEARAKEVRPAVEKLVTAARRQGLAARRLLASRLSENAAKKLFAESSKYTDRTGGYLRIAKLPQRVSDGARMAKIEFVK